MTNPYTYDTGKKNAVVQVENTDNLIQGAASLTYNAFNKVATVVQGTNTLTITYGPDRQRTKTVLVNGSATTTTLYAGNYEQRTANGTTTSYHYVASPDGLAAVYVKSGSTATAYYIETDHLGSIIRAYDYIGNIKFSAAYDAWGNQTVSTNAIDLTRGYCGHEHWNQFGLIDMNGRFYDPLIGRFLSPDPYVQAPDNPQNFNRYSYCLNNPLKYVDPTGYSITALDEEKRRLKRSCNYMQKYEKQGGGGCGYSWGDVINNSFSNITKQLISNMSESWGTLETSTIGHWVTYWYEIRGYNNREVYVIAGEVKVYEIIGNTTTINLPLDRGCSNGDYGSSGGSIASTATTVGANTSNIISTAAGTSVFNARNLSVAQQAKYGVNALKGIAKGAGTIGVGLTLTTAGIELAYGQANTHTIVDLCVCGAGLVCVGVAAVISAPLLALGSAVVGTVYGIGSAAGLGTTIDKASDNWGHKLIYGDEKDY